MSIGCPPILRFGAATRDAKPAPDVNCLRPSESRIQYGEKDLQGDGDMRHIDWHMLAYVGLGLINEFLVHFQLSGGYDWKRQRKPPL